MSYAGITTLALILSIAGTIPVSAQQRSESIVDRLLSQVAGDEEGEARRPTVVIGDRNAEERDDARRRGRTSRTDDVDREERARTATRTNGSDRAERAASSDRAARRGEHARRGTYEQGRRGTYEQGRRGTYEPGAGHKAGNGPPFCRSGEGHPKHGRQWCIDKGWPLGNAGRVFDTRRGERRYPTRNNDRTILDEILGRKHN